MGDLRIVLTGTEAWAIDAAAQQLRHAGHDVVEPDHQPLDGEAGSAPDECGCGVPSCPALVGADVVVTVRAHPLAGITRREAVVPAAVHHGIPIVVAGSSIPNPFVGDDMAVIEGIDDLAETCLALAAPARTLSMVAILG